MYLNFKFISSIAYTYNILLKQIKIRILYMYYLRHVTFIFSTNKINSILSMLNLIKSLYSILIKINNLYWIRLILLFNGHTNIKNFLLPNKYALTTVLKSPHTDKKSREQFHIVNYKSTLKYPLFFSVYNSNFLNFFFFFERGFNMILKTKNQI